MRKVAALLVTVVVWALAAAADDAIRPQDAPNPTVRGVALGGAEKDARAVIQKLDCGGKEGDRLCKAGGTIGDVPTSDGYWFGPDGLAVVIMRFSSSSYDPMREAFDGKFGPPTVCIPQTFKNLLGATFTFQRCRWVGKTMVVTIDGYDAGASRALHVETGQASFVPRAAFDKSVAEAEAQKKKALSDF